MLLKARWVLPVAGEPIEHGAACMRGSRIVDVGPHAVVAGRHPHERTRDLGEAVLLPGLVNVHAHLELTLLRGMLEGLPFFQWIRGLVALKTDALKSEDAVFHSLLGAAEMIRGGTTTVADCSDSGASFDALALAGLRGVVYQEVFAPAPSWMPHALPALESRLDALSAMASDTVRVGLSPHSPYMACDELLEATARIAGERGLPVSIHLAESADEDAFVRDGAGPIAEHHRGRGFTVTPRGRSPVEHLADRGWLKLPVATQLVHLACASPSDLDLVAAAASRRTAPLGLAACPRSNAQLGNGAPDLAGWQRRGLRFGLGTDGAPSVGACDLLAEMRHASFAWKAAARDATVATARDLVARCTLEAARSLGMDEEIGSLEIGKAADLCAIRLDAARMLPSVDPHVTLVQAATPDDVVLTVVAGQILWDGREMSTIDEDRVVARCAERVRLLRDALPRRS